MKRALFVAFLACCTHPSAPPPPPASAPPAAVPTYDDGPDKDIASNEPIGIDYPAIAARNPRATALCQEIYPCPPGSLDRPQSEWPFMCALAGVRTRKSEHIPGLTIESLACPYRKMGEGAIVGVPDDGSRPLVKQQDLGARVRAYPRLRVMLVDGLLDDPSCPIVPRNGVLHFCKNATFHGREQCVLEANDSMACAQENPERFLAACRARSADPTKPILADERYWGPGQCAVPSDHVRNGEVVGTISSGPGTSQKGEQAKIVLRAGGKEVRVLGCGEWSRDESYFVDGDTLSIDAATLVRRLDTDVMRATILARHADNAEWAVLLDPTGGADAAYPAPRTCKLAPGPRRHGNSIEFVMTPSIPNRAYAACSADVTTLQGSCTPLPRGTYCE